jgi:serine/threonine-protein kinase
MDDIAAGRVHSRITQTRKDEFGQLYNAFNKMANAIQQRDEGHSSER